MSGSQPSSDERPSRSYRASDRYQAGAKALGRIVRQIRQDRGLSLYQASAIMELELSHLQRIEAGTLNPTLTTLMRIADGLRIPLGDLFNDSAFAAPTP